MMMKAHNNISVVLGFVLMLAFMAFPAPVIGDATTIVPIVEGDVYYPAYGGWDAVPVEGDVLVTAEDSDALPPFIVSKGEIPPENEGYVYLQGNFSVDDNVHVEATKKVWGFDLFDEDDIVIPEPDEGETGSAEFGPLYLTNPDAKYMFYDIEDAIHINVPFNSGPMEFYDWDRPVLLQDGLMYGCMMPRESNVVVSVIFPMSYEEFDEDFDESEESDFFFMKWDEVFGVYTPFLSDPMEGNNMVLGWPTVGSGELCFALTTSENMNTLPIAVINADKTVAEPGETITFDCLDSVDFQNSEGDLGTVDYEHCLWDFGDGDTEVGDVVTHEYEEDGDYEVTLTVEDDDHTQDEDTEDIVIQTEPEEEPDEPPHWSEGLWDDLMTETGQLCLFVFVIVLVILVVKYQEEIKKSLGR